MQLTILTFPSVWKLELCSQRKGASKIEISQINLDFIFIIVRRSYSNRRIQPTCLYPCCHPIQIMWWFNKEITIVLFVHTPQPVVCDKLHNCNLPNRSTRNLNWMAKKIYTSLPNLSITKAVASKQSETNYPRSLNKLTQTLNPCSFPIPNVLPCPVKVS